MGDILGRRAEFDAVDELLAAARAGVSGSLVISGEAGIGKTVLVDHARETAKALGFRVESAVAAESETLFTFAGLHQLCARGKASIRRWTTEAYCSINAVVSTPRRQTSDVGPCEPDRGPVPRDGNEASELLEVALDGRRAADRRILRVQSCATAGPPLAEEIPAPVEFDLDLDHPPSIEICRRLLGLSRAEPMLFIGESIDRGQHGVVGCHVIPPGDVGPVAF